ncbi:MAG: hypothetical protein II640_01915, partial [Lachnospiraceae bacterium]|nr:hypothetical protein [Lachnospiraceae bacterium]
MAGHQRAFSFKDEAGSVVQEILRDYQGGRSIDHVAAAKEPDRNVIEKIIQELFQVVYPGYYLTPDASLRVFNMNAAISTIVDDIIINLEEQIEIALRYTDEFHTTSVQSVQEESERVTIEFMRRIPRVREYLDTDVQAMLEGDPAAYSKSEI